MPARIVAARIGAVPDGEAIVLSKNQTGTIDDIALFRDGDAYFALDNTCSHELASLSEGWIENETVECPLHTGKFCLRDGSVLSAPATEGVAAHGVEIEDGYVIVIPNHERIAAA